jgi:predicted dehydrogenase
MKKLKAGVIGCGVMGGFHLKQYLSISEVEVVGISDVDPSRAQAGIPFFTDAIELIKAADIVSITTPTSTHYKVAMEAIANGKHLLVEKPIAGNSKEGKEIIEAAKRKGVVLAVGHIERFNPAYKALISFIKGRKVEVYDIRRCSPFPARIGDASVIIDMMIHDIDLVLKLVGSKVKYVNAVGKKIKTQRLDQVHAAIVFENGVVANIEADRTHSDKIRSIVAAGRDMIFEADLLNKKAFSVVNHEKKDVPTEVLDQLNTELKDFIYAIMNKRTPSVTGEDGLEALKIAEVIEEKALASC